MNENQWKVGDVYHQAGGTIGGREADDVGEMRRDKADAIEDARSFLARLSDRERSRTAAYITTYRVTDVADDGSFGGGVSIASEGFEAE